MEKLLESIVTWIEYFKKKDEVNDKRLDNIEDYLSERPSSDYSELISRLEVLESKEEVKANDTGTNEIIE